MANRRPARCFLRGSALLALLVAFFLVLLQNSASRDFLRAVSITAAFPGRLQDVFVLALFLLADTLKMLLPRHG